MKHYNKFLSNNEVLIAVIPKTWLAYIGRAIVTVSIAFLSAFFSMPLLQGGVFMRAVFFMLCIMTAWQGIALWVRYVNNVLLLTDSRIIDISQGSIFNRRVSDMPYDRITTIDWSSLGLSEHVFHSGGLSIRAVGTERAIEMRPIRNPQRVQEIIRELMEFSVQ